MLKITLFNVYALLLCYTGSLYHPSPSKKVHPPQPSPPTSSLLVGTEKDQAVKINAFLSELFPERYAGGGGDGGNKKKKGAGKKVAVASKGGAAAAAQHSHHHHYVDEEHEDLTNLSPENIVSTLDSQLKAMKRELKLKDDKIRQLKDHSNLMATHMDRLKEEVSRMALYKYCLPVLIAIVTDIALGLGVMCVDCCYCCCFHVGM